MGQADYNAADALVAHQQVRSTAQHVDRDVVVVARLDDRDQFIN